jgi:hypothetical protein
MYGLKNKKVKKYSSFRWFVICDVVESLCFKVCTVVFLCLCIHITFNGVNCFAEHHVLPRFIYRVTLKYINKYTVLNGYIS